MSLNFNKPVTTDVYTSVLTFIRDGQAALAVGLDPAYAGTLTGTPVGGKRFNNGVVQQWNGTSWAAYPLAYASTSGATFTGTIKLLNDTAGVVQFDTSSTPNLGRLSWIAANAELRLDNNETAGAGVTTFRFSGSEVARFTGTRYGFGTPSPDSYSGSYLVLNKSVNGIVYSGVSNAFGSPSSSTFAGYAMYRGTTLQGFVRARGDDVMQIMNSQNAPLVFGTGGVEEMRLLSTGQLLVNRSADDLSGAQIQVGGGISGTFLQVSGATVPNSGVFRPAADTLGFSTADTLRMQINPSGSVSIGTTLTGGKVAIAGGEAVRLLGDTTYLSGYNAANDTRVGYVQFLTGTGVRIRADAGNILELGAGGATRAYVTASGSVGIGTADPGRTLEVSGGALTTPRAKAFTSTPSFDASEGNFHTLNVLTGNVSSISITNPAHGQFVTIRFKQDGTGGRTVNLGSSFLVAGAPNTAAGKVSYLNVVYNSNDSRWEGAWMALP